MVISVKYVLLVVSFLAITFLAHCHPSNTTENAVKLMPEQEHRHFDKRIITFENHTVPMNSSLRWFMDRLVDLGYYTVGVSRKCRENSVCHAAQNMVARMPEYFVEQGQIKLKNLPIQTLGNHEYTDAWVIGLASSNESQVCDDIYECDKSKMEPEDLSVMQRIMSQVWATPELYPAISENSLQNETAN